MSSRIQKARVVCDSGSGLYGSKRLLHRSFVIVNLDLSERMYQEVQATTTILYSCESAE